MLIPHTFDPVTHTYRVKGRYVFATSDILELAGVTNYEGVPKKNLDHGSERGTAVHDAIELYESGESPEVEGDVHQRFMGYLRFRDDSNLQILGPMEKTLVYEHEGTGELIGAKPDIWAALAYGRLFVPDVKTCFRTSGKKRDQQHLGWRLQTQSYKEGLAQCPSFWKTLPQMEMLRGIVQLHPKCGIVKRGAPRLGYEWHPFENDDSELWDETIRKAVEAKKKGKQLLR